MMILPAISLYQPWPYAMFHLGKNCENRSWALPEKYIGVPVLLHAVKKLDKESFASLSFRYGDLTSVGGAMLRSGIVGYAVFGGCRKDHPSQWAVRGMYHWVIEKATELPFHPCKGHQRFFTVEYPHRFPEAV